MKIRILFLALLSLFPLMTKAANITVSGVVFAVDPGEARVDYYKGSWGDVDIPNLIGDEYGNYYSVNEIYYAAFINNTIVTHVTLPNSIVWELTKTFENDTSLKSVKMSTGIHAYYGLVFAHCHSLTNVTFPPGLTNMYTQSFWDCPSLTNVVLGNNVITIGYQVFAGDMSLSTFAIPNSIHDIQAGAFQQCSNLLNVTIGSGLSFLGDAAFYACTSLTNVTWGTNVDFIGASAFENCSKLSGIVIPPRVKSILSRTFCGCSNLTKIIIPASVTNIMSDAFCHCGRLTNITFQGDAPTFSEKGDGMFDGVPTNAIVYYHYGTSGWGKTYDGLRTRQLFLPFFWTTNNFSISNLANLNITVTGYSGGFTIVPDTINGYPVVSIGSHAFLNANLTNVFIPGGITNIGSSAFANCTNLSSVTIGADVANVGSNAFLNCAGLTNITFLGNAPAFGANVFQGVPVNTTVQYLNGATGWGGSYDGLSSQSLSATPDGFGFALNADNTLAISSYSGAGGNIAIPGTIYGAPVSTINNLSGGPSLTGVMIPDSVTSIGSYAINNCYNVTNVTIGSGLTNMGDYVFSGCGSLTNLVFHGDAPALGFNTFANIGFGATIHYRPGMSGWGATFGGLPSIIIVDTMSDEWTYATYSDHVEIVGYSGVGGAVTIPGSINDFPVSVIDDPQDGPYVTSLTIPANVAGIADNSFTNDVNLTNITFLGNAPALGTNVFTGVAAGATIYYLPGTTGWGTNYGGLPTAELDDPFIYQVNPDGTLTIAGLTTNNFSSGLNIPPFVYGSQTPQSVTSIGAGVFANLNNLTDVMVPTNITTIGDGAFSGCNNLTNITFLGDAPAPATDVFLNVGAGATVYYLPGAGGWGATFDGLPTSMITTTSDGFGFTINEDKTITITNYSGTNSAVTVPDGIYGHPVSVIDDPQDGFIVTSLTIPDSVVTITDNSFNNWSALTNITFLGNAPALGTNVFNGLGAGATVYYYYGTTGWGTTYGGLPAVQLGAPGAPQLSGGSASVQAGRFRFTITGATNQVVTVETSTNLVDWSAVQTITLDGTSTNFSDPNWTNYSRRFYRAR